MKKITLLLFSCLAFVFTWQSNAQLTEGFEAGLVSLTNDSGNGVDWTISTSYFSEGAQSAYNAYASSNNNILVSGALDISGLTAPRLTFDHIAKTEGTYDFCYVEVSVDGSTWVELAVYDEDSYPEWGTTDTTPANDWWTSEIIDLTTYISTTTYIRFRLESDSSVSRYGWLLDNVVVEETPTDELDYYNLQWPPTGTITDGDGYLVYAQAYEAGLTDVDATPSAGIEAWIGYSTTDSDPSGAGWTWVAASPNPGYDFSQNNDEYILDLDTEVAVGTFYYAARWRLNGGPFTYGGIDAGLGGADGVWDGTEDISGVLTVNPPPGDLCTDPIVIGSLPYNTTDDTGNYSDDYTGSPGSTGCGTTSSYLNGDDVVYAYTAGSDTSINISMTPTNTWSGIFVYTDCADIGTTCVAGEANSGSTERNFDLDVTNGTTYYIVISTFPSPQSTPYTLDITENTCTDPTVAFSVVNDCGTSGGFLIEADITDLGTATSLTISDDQGSSDQNVSAIGVVTFGPYTNGTDVTLTVANDQDSNCSVSSAALTQVACPPANDDCANATVLVCGTPLTGQTTVGATGGSSSSCVGSIGDDVWYVFTGNDNTVDLNLNASVEEGQIGVYESSDGTCGGFTLGTCIASGGSGGNPVAVSFDADLGTTYFIRVGNWINGDPGVEFELSATCTPYPTCLEPTALTGSVATATTATLGWTAGGSEALWDVEVVDITGGGSVTGTPTATGVSNPYTATGLTEGNSYEFYVRADCTGGDLSAWAGPFSWAQILPPANDDCTGATVLIQETGIADAASATSNSGTLEASTDSGLPAEQCGSFTGNANDDVWYAFEALTSDVNITVDDGATFIDLVIQAYSGSCGALTNIGCADGGNPEEVQLTGLNVGETYYFRVYQYGTSSTAGKTIDVKLWSTTALSVDDSEFFGFKYYPNPVQGTLSLRAQQNIQNVAVYNIMGQEVINVSPNSISNDLNTSTLSRGTYFVRISINGAVENFKIIKE